MWLIRIPRLAPVIGLLLIAAATPAREKFTDLIILKDGTRVPCNVLLDDGLSVTAMVRHKTILYEKKFPRDQVKEIQRGALVKLVQPTPRKQEEKAGKAPSKKAPASRISNFDRRPRGLWGFLARPQMDGRVKLEQHFKSRRAAFNAAAARAFESGVDVRDVELTGKVGPYSVVYAFGGDGTIQASRLRAECKTRKSAEAVVTRAAATMRVPIRAVSIEGAINGVAGRFHFAPNRDRKAQLTLARIRRKSITGDMRGQADIVRKPLGLGRDRIVCRARISGIDCLIRLHGNGKVRAIAVTKPYPSLKQALADLGPDPRKKFFGLGWGNITLTRVNNATGIFRLGRNRRVQVVEGNLVSLGELRNYVLQVNRLDTSPDRVRYEGILMGTSCELNLTRTGDILTAKLFGQYAPGDKAVLLKLFKLDAAQLYLPKK